MITHYIIMSSSYSKGKRIALDYPIKEKKEEIEEIEFQKLRKIFFSIAKECGNDVSISTHFVQTDSLDWRSIVDKDHFFKDVEVVSSVDEFIKLIKNDRILIGLDVAKYILCKVKCTHLKLEKLVYLCFAEYLCKYSKELYKDKILAYRYGPVVKSVYDKYKRYGYEEISKDNINIDSTDVFEMPSRSRILFAEDGIEKIKSIDETLEKYGNYPVSALVELTHKKKTPWDVSGRGKNIDKIIENKVIKKYHCNEII